MLREFHDHKQAVYSCTKLEIFNDHELNVINKLLAHNSRNESSSLGRCLFPKRPIVNKKKITERRIKKQERKPQSRTLVVCFQSL